MVGFNKEHAKAMLFHDLPDDEAEKLASSLPKQPKSCFVEPVHWDPYGEDEFNGIFGYIFTEADRILPMEIQRSFASAAKAEHTHVLQGSSHSPHLEQPEKLAKIVIRMVQEIVGAK